MPFPSGLQRYLVLPNAPRPESSPQHLLHQALLDAQARAGIGLFIIDNGRISYANQAICQMFGYTEAEVLALPSFLSLAHPDSHDLLRRNHARRLAGEQFGNSYEVGIVTKDGTRRDAQITIVAMPSDEGVKLLVIVIDVTERKAAQGAQRRSAAMLRDIVEGTARVTGAEFFRALVRHMARALGVPIALVGEVRASDPTRLHSLALWTGDGFAPTIDYELDISPCGQVFGGQASLVARNLRDLFPQARCALEQSGAESYFGYPLTGSGGEPLGVLAIMDRKPMLESDERASLMSIFATRAAAELERLRAEAGVRRSEQKFSRIFHASPVPMSMSRLGDGHFLEVNDAYLRNFGWPREAMLGRTALDLALWIDREQRRIWVEVLRREGRIADFQARMRDAHGNEHDVLISAEVLMLDGEECVLVFIDDVTERLRAEAEIRELNAELEERVARRTAELSDANRELESFAYSISHDLRAPLRSMNGFAQALLDSEAGKLGPSGQDCLRRITQSARWMDALLKDLLEYSRVARASMPPSVVNLDELVSEILAVRDSEINEKQARFEITAPLGDVKAHSPTVQQILANLIDNGLKFINPARLPHLRIWTEREANRTPPMLRIWIEDNGIGINPEYHEKIFGLFERLHPSQAFPGTGIGLAIVRKGVERMGGHVGLESQPDQGTRFWVEFPAAKKE
jgi:PAS domain S-box-containing protein